MQSVLHLESGSLKYIEGLLNLTFSFVCNLTFIKIELLRVKT